MQHWRLEDAPPNSVLADRTLFIISSGFMGQVRKANQEGDQIVIIFGLDVSFVVRREAQHFVLIGKFYVHGLLNGVGMVRIDVNRYEELGLGRFYVRFACDFFPWLPM